MTLYLLDFNNYYNRIVKRRNTIEEYGEPLAIFENINFNPNDGINTEQIINYYGQNPDYLVVTDEEENIISRWYIIDGIRTRGQQYNLVLYRDLLADWYYEILESPIFIEKTMLSINNPLIFNNENMSYNQILTEQTELKDELGCPWIVGYIPRNFANDDTPKRIEADVITSSGANYVTDNVGDLIYSLTGLSLNGSSTTSIRSAPLSSSYIDINARVRVNRSYTSYQDIARRILLNSGVISTIEKERSSIYQPGFSYDRAFDGYALFNLFTEEYTNKDYMDRIRDEIKTSFSSLSYEKENEINLLNNRTIFDNITKKSYKIKVNKTVEPAFSINITVDNRPALYYLLLEGLDFSTGFSNTPVRDSFQLRYDSVNYSITLEEFSEKVYVDISKERDHLLDSPYDMFCIPYGAINLEVPLRDAEDNEIILNYTTSADAAMAIGINIGLEIGSDAIYDVQLLPYCPIRKAIVDNNKIRLQDDSLSFDVIYQKGQENYPETAIQNVVLWAKYSTFSFDIPFEINIKEDPIEFKVENECSFYRLCSPNYSGAFDFNAMKNYGLNYIHVDCQYKPYNPFIHLKPYFSNLYGIDPEKDIRGLICGGDFSLPQASSAWENYQLNNKNYQEIFNRQIENMDIKNDIQREKDIYKAATGILGGGISGGIAGAKGGVVGAVAGAATGVMTAAIGGAMNYQWNEALRSESIAFAMDNFGYQLGNIQAIPYTLSKISAFNNTNKIFPFIEYYTCTDAEKDALRKKIIYDGMTTMAIGTIKDYQLNAVTEYTYIKGKLIRFNAINESAHTTNQISNELNKGAYYE